MSDLLENLHKIYRYRSLISALVQRHLSMRYRGSVLGFLWTFLNPLLLMAVYTLVFKYYIRFAEVENYTIFLFCGLLPWIWISSALIEGTTSIVSGGHLITKSMFPAHVLPIVAVIVSMINFILSIPLLLLFMYIAGVSLHITFLLFPVVVSLQLVFTSGLAVAFSGLNVLFRDVQHIVGNLLTLLFFLCPILYPVSVVPDRFKFTMDLNPFAVLITMYHNVILEGVIPSIDHFLVMICYALIAVIIGNGIYDRFKESFAELL